MASQFHVVDALKLNAETDVFIGLPQESTNKQTFHRVPVRSSSLDGAGDERIRVQFVNGSKHVVQSCRSLKRLVIRFPSVFVPWIKTYNDGNEDGGVAPGGASHNNLSMGFGLYDSRSGPTPEEEKIMKNIDRLSAFLRTNLVCCEKLRTTLKIGNATMTPDQQRMMADTIDLHIVRPLDPSQTKVTTGRDGEERMRSRYCYVKIVPPEDHIPKVFHTFFWTPEGKPIPLQTVLNWKYYHATPLVEIEDIFVNKAVRSVQLKLRECIIKPPSERANVRFSMCFPDKVCEDVQPDATEEEEEPPLKRQRADGENEETDAQE